jgi:hypothetical protein
VRSLQGRLNAVLTAAFAVALAGSPAWATAADTAASDTATLTNALTGVADAGMGIVLSITVCSMVLLAVHWLSRLFRRRG